MLIKLISVTFYEVILLTLSPFKSPASSSSCMVPLLKISLFGAQEVHLAPCCRQVAHIHSALCSETTHFLQTDFSPKQSAGKSVIILIQ